MATPLQTVNERYGSKEKLVSQLVSNLDPQEGESKDEFKARLVLRTSNSKLLRLVDRVEAVKAFGGFDKLAEAVTSLQGGGTLNQERLEKNKMATMGRLLDMHKVLSKKK
jgi:hypothetical protein